MTSNQVVTTTEDLPVDEHTPPLVDFDGYRITPTARGSVTAHELTTDVDGEPLGVDSVVLGHWEVGRIEPAQ